LAENVSWLFIHMSQTDIDTPAKREHKVIAIQSKTGIAKRSGQECCSSDKRGVKRLDLWLDKLLQTQ